MPFKNGVTAFVVFVSAVAGVAVGDLLINREEPEAVSSFTSLPSYRASLVDQGMDLELSAGDLFPLENCETAAGQPSNFEIVLRDKPSLIIFSSPGCTQCEMLYEALGQSVSLGHMNLPQIVSAVNKDARGDWEEIAPTALPTATTIYIDEPAFRDKYNLRVIPSIVAVDRFGFVQHKQIGYVDGLDPEIIYFLNNQ